MKRTILLTFVLLMTSSSVTLFGGTTSGPSGKISFVVNGDVITLIYKGDEATGVKVAIRDQRNQNIFSEKIWLPCGFRRPYNLSELPEGSYTFVVTDDTVVHSEEIRYQKEEKEGLVVHVNKLPMNDDKYLLIVPNHDEKEITVSIYDDEANLCYVERERITADFAKVYNLEKLHLRDRKRVTFQVSDSNGSSMSIDKN